MYIILDITIFFILFLSGCGSNLSDDGGGTGYKIDAPDVSIILPDTLHEISGLTTINSTSVACIQDEYGIIFIYDVIKYRSRDLERWLSWSKAHDWKSCVRGTVPRVRIPLSPP